MEVQSLHQTRQRITGFYTEQQAHPRPCSPVALDCCCQARWPRRGDVRGRCRSCSSWVARGAGGRLNGWRGTEDGSTCLGWVGLGWVACLMRLTVRPCSEELCGAAACAIICASQPRLHAHTCMNGGACMGFTTQLSSLQISDLGRRTDTRVGIECLHIVFMHARGRLCLRFAPGVHDSSWLNTPALAASAMFSPTRKAFMYGFRIPSQARKVQLVRDRRTLRAHHPNRLRGASARRLDSNVGPASRKSDSKPLHGP